MLNETYKLRTGIAGLIGLAGGGTMEVTIPAGSILGVISDGREEARVMYQDSPCVVSLRDLQRCGSLVASLFGDNT